MKIVTLILLLASPLLVAAPGESVRPELDAIGGGALQMFLGLLVVLGLMAGAVWFLRRYTPLQRGDGALKVVGGLALGARERLVLIETGGVRLLLGVVPGKVERLHVFADAETTNFAAQLAKAGSSVASRKQEVNR